MMGQNGANSKWGSKDFIKIKKPMVKLSCFIFLSIFILSGFYLLSLWALGFFSGETQILLKLKSKMFQEHIGLSSYNFDLQQYIYKQSFNFSRLEDKLDDHILESRLHAKSQNLSLNTYDINKNILGLRNKKLKKDLLNNLSKNLCDRPTDLQIAFESKGDEFKERIGMLYGFNCSDIRASILKKGKFLFTVNTHYFRGVFECNNGSQ